MLNESTFNIYHTPLRSQSSEGPLEDAIITAVQLPVDRDVTAGEITQGQTSRAIKRGRLCDYVFFVTSFGY